MFSHYSPASLTLFCQQQLTLKKKLKFGYYLVLAKMQVMWRGFHVWDEVAPHIYLGQIPTVKLAEKLTNKIPNLSLVVSVVEPSEFTYKTFPEASSMQTPAQWKALGVEHYLLATPDFGAELPPPEVKQVIGMIKQYTDQNLDVYIHCKSGEGRSSTLMAIYLLITKMRNKELTTDAAIDETYQFIRAKRGQVHFREEHLNKIKEIVTYILSTPSLDEAETPVIATQALLDRLDGYVATPDAKEKISQLISIKSLMIYGCEYAKSMREEIIKKFIKEIVTAENAEWVINFMRQQSVVHSLVKPSIFYHDLNLKTKKLLKILTELKRELAEHFAEQLGCDQNFLMSQMIGEQMSSEKVDGNTMQF
ncbi:MAG: dual specificity protein phosphatase family protein [Gammaproteobacteria bacterium]|nr:dual specificity protein phosphatase family protein [Gammaproteobacteria bacterium]